METQNLHNQQKPPQALWAFGSNGNGQLGVGHDQDSVIPSLACMADHGQTPRHPNAHWHINDPVDFAASGGNHSALISCPDRTLWMAGSDDDHQCLRPAKFGTGNTNTVQSDTAGTATAARATTSAATVEEAESLASSLQFHRVADLPFLQALDRQSVARGKVYRAANDGLCGSSVHSIRWCSVACGWAFTIAVAEVEEEKAGTASTKAPEMDICSVHSRHQIDRPQVMEKAVFAWGAGSFGELGLGPGVNKTGDRPERVLVGCLARTLSSTPSSLRYEIFKVRAGLRHVLALARDREQGGKTVLVGWGNNRHGQIGMLVEPPSTTTMAHNTKKKGSGLPDVHTKISEPALLYLAPMDASSAQYKPGVEIMDVACGQNHSLVLLSDGAVYSSGLNKHGQLGPSYSDDSGSSLVIHTPKTLPFRIGFQQVAGLPSVNRISCGWSHNVAMNSNTSELYLWGRSDRGQLGSSTPISRAANTTSVVAPPPDTTTKEDSPPLPWSTLRRLQIALDDGAPETIRSLSCGSEHTLALAESGKVYAWGWNEHGNCGIASPPPTPGSTTLLEAAENEDRSDVLVPRTVFIPSSSSKLQRAHGQVMGGYGSSWVLLQES